MFKASPLVLIFQKTFALHLDLPHLSPYHAIKPTERSGGDILPLNSINPTECVGLPWNPSISSADSPATLWWKKSFGREGPEPLPGVSCTNKSKTGRCNQLSFKVKIEHTQENQLALYWIPCLLICQVYCCLVTLLERLEMTQHSSMLPHITQNVYVYSQKQILPRLTSQVQKVGGTQKFEGGRHCSLNLS